jgi:radical SAM protein with 4Fe4S-binding SPASM domain
MNVIKPKIDRVRYESFGGIVSCLDPPFLAWVDRDFMRKLGHTHSPLWDNNESVPYLSAPTEVHFAVTNKCGHNCSGCYMDSRVSPRGELSTKELKGSLKKLRDFGVFHVALGGGEAFERDDFHEIVVYCREIGLVPNLTTNGASIGGKEIMTCRLMGQVNISLDGIGKNYGVNGRNGDFDLVHKNIRKLKREGIQVGINCVVSRNNFYGLGDVVKFAIEENLNEVEFLKFKPSGRGRMGYEQVALTQEMLRSFYPALLGHKKPEAFKLKIDCSFIPAMLFHKPPKKECEKWAVIGCDGGNLLLSVRSTGTFAGCSFIENNDCEPISEIGERWHSSVHLRLLRELTIRARQPCCTCDYLSICRCGCRASALYHTGDFFAPDPECPFVYDYEKRLGSMSAIPASSPGRQTT